MQAGLVSVVVPVYKTEKYLDRCVSSIVNQTYRNLEILLIDDGSPDKCPQLCDEWAQKDSRIHVIHKQNAGAGRARNTGIENASGEYICFIDSDDYADADMIASAYAAAQIASADIVLYGFSNVNSKGRVTSDRFPEPRKKIYIGEEVQDELLSYQIYPSPAFSLWCSLYSMHMIQKASWRIPSEREVYAEDAYALIDLYKYIECAVILPKSLYYYCNNGVSLSHSARVGDFDKIKDFYQKCIILCRKNGYSTEIQRKCIYSFIGLVIAALKYHAAIDIDGRRNIKRIVDDNTLQHAINEIAKDKQGVKRKVLFWAIQRRYYNLCYVLLVVQNLIK